MLLLLLGEALVIQNKSEEIKSLPWRSLQSNAGQVDTITCTYITVSMKV